MEPRSKPLVDILLSTYNGQKFLAEQIESILAQSYTDWQLLVRDDGSKDSTLQILTEYAARDPRIVLVEANTGNRGFALSFMRLLEISKADYVMFSDQDDVWLPLKVECSLANLQLGEGIWPDKPLLLHSDLTICDLTLMPVATSLWEQMQWTPQHYVSDAERLMVVPVVSGNTVIINRWARDVSLPSPSALFGHDLWIALRVKIAGGSIISLPVPTLLYRRHAKSASSGGRGFNASYLARAIGRLPVTLKCWRREYVLAADAGVRTTPSGFATRKFFYLLIRLLKRF